MKKITLLFVYLIFVSCNYFEVDHEIKEVVREYLSKKLHNPESLEEIEWDIEKYYVLKHIDSTDNNSPYEIDFIETIKEKEEGKETNFIRFRYRAENGYGAMRKEELYAIQYKETGLIEFDNIAHSKKIGFFKPDNKFNFHINAKYRFVKNRFFMLNSGNATHEDFLKEFPEFN